MSDSQARAARDVYDHAEAEEQHSSADRRRRPVADWGVGEDVFDHMPRRRFSSRAAEGPPRGNRFRGDSDQRDRPESRADATPSDSRADSAPSESRAHAAPSESRSDVARADGAPSAASARDEHRRGVQPADLDAAQSVRRRLEAADRAEAEAERRRRFARAPHDEDDAPPGRRFAATPHDEDDAPDGPADPTDREPVAEASPRRRREPESWMDEVDVLAPLSREERDGRRGERDDGADRSGGPDAAAREARRPRESGPIPRGQVDDGRRTIQIGRDDDVPSEIAAITADRDIGDEAPPEPPPAAAAAEPAPRRTVRIDGRPEGSLGEARFHQGGSRRRDRGSSQRFHARPELLAAWAFALGLLLILIAILTAH